MSVILDAGAFVAVERNHRDVIGRLEVATRAGIPVRTTGVVVGQVWRTGKGRQAPLARVLAGTEVIPVDRELGAAAGTLIGRAGTADPIDATVVLIARSGDSIITSDPNDIRRLLVLTRARATILAC